MELLEQIKENAKKHGKTIVLPEGTEERTIKAADQIIGEGIAKIILIGNPTEIQALAEKHQLKNIEKAIIVNPESHDKKDQYADLLVELRKSKGMTKEQALKLVTDPLYLATLMIKSGDADGEVAGALNATGDVLRPALQIVKTLPGISVVSGAFLLLTNKPEYGENGLIAEMTPESIADQIGTFLLNPKVLTGGSWDCPDDAASYMECLTAMPKEDMQNG